jgi:copper(I)-binding protein
MMKKIQMALFLVALLLVSPVLWAHSSQQGDIQIGHIWARATAVGATTASVYVPLLNKGIKPDSLQGGHTPVAEGLMLHESTMRDGVSHMEMLESLPLPAGQPVAMKPNGKHIMLTGMKRQLKEGETFPLTLHFEHADDATIEVMVHAAGATSGNH